MKHLTLLAAAAALSVAGTAPANAAVTILTFDESCAAGPCSPGSFFLQSYGDSAEVDLSYQVLDVPGAGAVVDYPVYWNVGYGDLSQVAWSGSNGVGEVAFSVLQPNTSVSLLSLDTAGWGAGYHTAFRIYDLSYNLLYDSGALIAPGVGHLSIDLQDIASANGLRLQWDETWGVAIDNLAFNVETTSVGAVPEPSTWATMILGFGAVGGVLRSRRRGRSEARVAAI